MKFVTVVLAVFLAAGCQAAPLQADAPLINYVDHGRAAVREGLNQFKTTLLAICDKLTDQETKDRCKAKVEEGYNQITDAQLKASQVTNAAVQTVDEATQDLRRSLREDFENVKAQVDPMGEELKVVVDKHIEEYKASLIPILSEYRAKQEEEIKEWKGKFMPVIEDLRAKMDVNVEETKGKLIPIIDVVYGKLKERLESLKAMAAPYMQEYSEQLKTAVAGAKDINTEQFIQNVQPYLENVKTGVAGIAGEVQKAVSQ